MDDSLVLAQCPEVLPGASSLRQARPRLRVPGTAFSVRVRSLALCVSAGLHLAFLTALVGMRLAAPLPVPQPLVEVEFVEIAGAKGGGCTPAAPAPQAAQAPAAARPAGVPSAVAIRDKSARTNEPAPQQTAPASVQANGPATGVTTASGSGGSGGGTGGGQGTGAGRSVGSGTGQGGVAVDRMPVVLKSVKPVYPMSARRRGISGKVTLRLYVDAEGGVREVQVQSAEPVGVFEEKAVEAAHKWRFEPAVFKGAPVGVWMTLPVRFALDER